MLCIIHVAVVYYASRIRKMVSS